LGIGAYVSVDLFLLAFGGCFEYHNAIV